MGILNLTPDSFYPASRLPGPSAAVETALRMKHDGADILDVGGESSRPGARSISVQEELDRVIPVIEAIRAAIEIPLSVDTTKAEVASEALDAGASIVNDISALRSDPRMAGIIAQRGAYAILMHMKGMPESMQAEPVYDDVVAEILSFLEERMHYAEAQGVPRAKLMIDPGIGFGKRIEHNLAILRATDAFADLGVPLMIGASRKSFLGHILGLPVEERLEATIAVHAVAVARGADVIRVHDVKEGRRTADIAVRLRPHVD